MYSPKKKIKRLFLCLILTGFAIIISCSKDEESLANDVLKDAYYARTFSNEAPVAEASASVISGKAPLEVKFMSKSTDDRAIRGYAWDFGNGITSSKKKSPLRTLKEPGIYNVKLTVRDAKGLTSSDTVTITVNSTANETTANEAPMATATTTVVSGAAPLQVDFTGSNSSDDKGVVEYSWDFQDGSLSIQANPSHTFNDPGIYNISLTVTDAEGLEDTAILTITVEQESIVPSRESNIACGVGGGYANDTGEKIWCWDNIGIPDYTGKGTSFSNSELFIDSECYEKQVTKDGSRLKFHVSPKDPNVGSWCSNDYNMRAEIRTAPWDIRHPKGTEEWFGWSYTFGNDYVIDLNNEWAFFQVHPSITGLPPQTELMVIRDGQFNGHGAGEVYIVNQGDKPNHYNPTGITPRAGETLDVVVHAVWGDSSNGMLQVWINGNKVYDKQVSTVYPDYPWGGNAKWGIYKWPWRNGSDVQQSLDQGVTHLETYMGTLRMITRRPGEADYGKDSYSLVAPD